MQRSLLIFLESVQSQATQKQYQYYLNSFMTKFDYQADYDRLAKTDPVKIQIDVEDYVMNLKKTVNPNSIPSYIYPIQSFLDANDIDLRWKKIKRLFPAHVKKGGKSAYTTEQIQKLLDATPDLRNQVLIHTLASTGCRIGALYDLRLEHLTRLPEGYIAIKFYNEDVEEYYSFLTPEASEILDRYFNQRTLDGEILTEQSPVFRERYKLGKQPVKPMSKRAFEQVVIRALKKSGQRAPTEKKRNRYEIPVNHGFRKRFVTILKSSSEIPVGYAERLAGHMVYADEFNNKIQLDDSYLRPKLDKLLSYFKLVVGELTIDQTEKAKQILEKQQQKLDELEQAKIKMSSLESRLRELEKAENDSDDVILHLLKNPKLADLIRQKIEETVDRK